MARRSGPFRGTELNPVLRERHCLALAMERASRIACVYRSRIVALADEHSTDLIVAYSLRPTIVVDDDIPEDRVIVEVEIGCSAIVAQDNVAEKRIPGCTDVKRKSDADRLEAGILIPMEVAADGASADRPEGTFMSLADVHVAAHLA